MINLKIINFLRSLSDGPEGFFFIYKSGWDLFLNDALIQYYSIVFRECSLYSILFLAFISFSLIFQYIINFCKCSQSGFLYILWILFSLQIMELKVSVYTNTCNIYQNDHHIYIIQISYIPIFHLLYLSISESIEFKSSVQIASINFC